MAVDLLDLGEFTGNEDEGSGFNPIDSGRYRATVFEISREVGKNSGKPYLKWCFQICEGEPFAGRRLGTTPPSATMPSGVLSRCSRHAVLTFLRVVSS